jgi:hypothetical protein
MFPTENSFTAFKREINLATFASEYGYKLDRKKSTKTSIAMKSSNDKVIITKKGGKWVYFSVHDDSDSGTIVDFVANRSGKSIAEIGTLLSQWSGLGRASLPSYSVTEKKHDVARVRAIFARCKVIDHDAYLESRRLGRNILGSPRFKGRIYRDRHGNLAFPHYSNGKICGLELKNTDRGLLVKGSQKTFWRSNTRKTDTTVIVTESVIDALSHHLVAKPCNSFYLATGGGVSSRQCGLLIKLLESSEKIIDVIVATDNDPGGDRIARKIFEAVDRSLYNGKIIRRRPKGRGSDWNDLLMRR